MRNFGSISDKIRVGIIGATGYAGAEILRLLSVRDDVSVVALGSHSYMGREFTSEYGSFRGVIDLECVGEDMAELSKKADVIFTATPQGFCSSKISKKILDNCRVIDLSADFRITDAEIYEKWYGITHPCPELISSAVYGLPELYRDKIKEHRLIANPGCYPTCSILSTYPLLKRGLIDPDTLIIDAKSGTSGAGRGAKTQNLFCEVNESIKPYSVGTHRHTPEIEQELSNAAGRSVTVSFTPHLVPMQRGILVTAYARLTESVSEEDLRSVYREFYENEYFVRVLPAGVYPETRWVKGSNFCDVSVKLDQRTNRVIMCGAIDNMVKGAAGQAVQNMNIMFGMPENTGLRQLSAFP